MPKPILSPKSDFIFKLIFGDKNNLDILADFLQAVLDIPPEEYERLTIIDPHLRKTDAEDKLGILDVRLETKSGKEIDIDIQVINAAGLRERIVYYASKMITEQMSEGADYRRIKQVISIIITDFVLIKDSGEYHNGYVLYDPKSGSVFSDILVIHILELPKAAVRGADGTGLYEWMKFLSAEGEEEYMAVGERNPRIGKAVAVLKRLSEDEATRMLAEAREKQRRDERGRLIFAREEGRKEGEERGRKKGIQQRDADILALINEGWTMEQIKQHLERGGRA